MSHQSFVQGINELVRVQGVGVDPHHGHRAAFVGHVGDPQLHDVIGFGEVVGKTENLRGCDR